MKYINITYPFKDSEDGYYLKMNVTDADAIKSDLMHLLLTSKGQRLYMPDFGTNLRKFLFNKMDGITISEITDEINQTISKYIPNLKINKILVEEGDNQYTAKVNIDYTVTNNVFAYNNNLTIQL